MTWMQRLADVYDNNQHRIGIFEKRYNREYTLVPIAHVTQNAQLEVILKGDGTFHRARVVPKEESRTIIPATLNSANRTNSPVPHYVHDKLSYVAKDFKKFGSDRKQDGNFDMYETQMVDWASQSNAPEKVKKITAYIQKGTLIQDLIDNGIIYLDYNDDVIEKWTREDTKKYDIEKPDIYKETSKTVFDAIVRFDVLNDDPETPSFWKDKTIFDNYVDYIQERMTNNRKLIESDPSIFEKGICYVTGKEEVLTTQHGKNILISNAQPKLITSNDERGFTYRGRFKIPTEAVQIGYEISQKSHQALRWLLQHQGIYINSRYFVTFGHKITETLDPFASTFDLLGVTSKSQESETEKLAAQEVSKAIMGLANNIKNVDDNKLITMALDAATTGRLAIVYYQETEPKLFIESLIHWHTLCRWQLFYWDSDKKKRVGFSTPSTFEMAKAIYGDKANASIKEEFYTRILPSILEKRKIPKDMIQSIYHRVIRPESFKETKESWLQTLNIACAMISYNNEKEIPNMSIQKSNTNRDYLFGRLLGVAETMERTQLNNRNESRATNATRYFNAFSNRPARTWLVIRKQLQPYFNRLGSKSTFYIKTIQEIEDTIGPEGMTDIPLKPIFLTGYSSQVQEYYKKKEEKDDENDTSE